MLNFQDANRTSNRIDTNFDAGTVLHQDTSFAMHCWVDLLTQDVDNRYMISMRTDNNNRIEFHMEALNPPHLSLSLGGSAATTSTLSTSTIDTALHAVGFSYNGAVTRYYLDGVADGLPAQVTVPDVTGEILYLGNRTGGARGLRGLLGHAMVWSGTINAAGFTLLNNGVEIPDPTNLIYWHRCLVVPGWSEVPARFGAHVEGTTENTVTVTASTPPDEYYQEDDGSYLVLGSWVSALVSSGLFGAQLAMEPLEKILPVIMRVAGCHIDGLYKHEVAYLFDKMRFAL
jgi:hypothetical protein